MDRDAVILSLYRNGFHQKAMALLMDHYGDDLWRYILTLVNNEDDAADLSQETLIKVYRNLSGFRGDSLLRTWIFSIARNTAFSWMQTRNFRTSQADDAPDQSRFSDDEAESITEKDSITPLIRQLSPPLQTPLTLHYYMGCSYEESAAILAIPINTLKARIRRAKLALAGLLRSAAPEAVKLGGAS